MEGEAASAGNALDFASLWLLPVVMPDCKYGDFRCEQLQPPLAQGVLGHKVTSHVCNFWQELSPYELPFEVPHRMTCDPPDGSECFTVLCCCLLNSQEDVTEGASECSPARWLHLPSVYWRQLLSSSNDEKTRQYLRKQCAPCQALSDVTRPSSCLFSPTPQQRHRAHGSDRSPTSVRLVRQLRGNIYGVPAARRLRVHLVFVTSRNPEKTKA